MAPALLPRPRELPVAHAVDAESRSPRPLGTVRDVGIDALRGFAVFIMVGANMARYMLDEPYPFWLRISIRRRWPNPRSFWGRLLLGS